MPVLNDIVDLDDDRIADYRDVRDADLRGGPGRVPRGQPSLKLCMVESAPVGTGHHQADRVVMV